MARPATRWRRGVVAVTALVALRGVALVQAGCVGPRTDGAWRATVRARPEALARDAVVPEGARWVRRFALPAPLAAACDLASTPRGLVVAASVDALAEDGAAVFRWTGGAALQTLLRWDGQGFLRVHAWGDTLVVPDADAPFRALPFLFDLDVDGYVFVSSPDGALTARGREVLPAVYHVFDVARRADGRLVAATGAYHPDDVAYLSPRAPAALFVDDGPGRPWRRLVEHPSPDARGVFRFTYLLALPDGALLAGTEAPGLGGAARVEPAGAGATVRPVAGLAGYVLRWAAWRDAVLAVVQASSGTALMRSDDGGRSFRPVPSPRDPESVAVAGGALYVLADGALYRTEDGAAFTARVPRHAALAHRASSLVSAPLVAHGGRLWAASTRTGEVFEAR